MKYIPVEHCSECPYSDRETKGILRYKQGDYRCLLILKKTRIEEMEISKKNDWFIASIDGPKVPERGIYGDCPLKDIKDIMPKRKSIFKKKK